MLLNISGRTDIVNHYSEWLFNRFAEGYVLSRNSLFQNSVRRYELAPDQVDCLIFGSKNYTPILGRIHEITERFNTYFYYTITAYGKDIEPGVPDIETSIDTLLALSKIVGAQRIAWRYDPILLTEKYTVAHHLAIFAHMAERLSGHVDRCIFSFVEMYKKHTVNLPELIPISAREMEILARGLGEIAAKHQMILQTCGPEANYAQYGIKTSGCVTLDILGQANHLQFRSLKHKGFRKGCHCIESRDIGARDSCLNGCKYCYANKNGQLPLENYQQHDPQSPLLLGHLKPTDRLQPGAQKSFLQRGAIYPNKNTAEDI